MPTSVITGWFIVIYHHRTFTGWTGSLMGCERNTRKGRRKTTDGTDGKERPQNTQNTQKNCRRERKEHKEGSNHELLSAAGRNQDWAQNARAPDVD